MLGGAQIFSICCLVGPFAKTGFEDILRKNAPDRKLRSRCCFKLKGAGRLECGGGIKNLAFCIERFRPKGRLRGEL